MIVSEKTTASTANFIHSAIDEDLANKRFEQKVHTRFPPEPNGYLHIGHAKAICIDFGTAEKYGGLCNLRFDDTNPGKEDVEYTESIQRDVRWLGFDWGDRLFYASDYFDVMYEQAEGLIKKGLAYVCDLSPEEVKEYRGTLTEAGKPSPYRDRSVEENLDLFRRMRDGEFADGSRVLRAKIDMASPNINMRDPVIYRIQRGSHHRTGDKWCIYPMYDYAHPIEDSLENITHSLCSLEFENHRPLYDWVLDNVDLPCHSRQIEFARLNLTYTVMSKRKLRQLVEAGQVSGWDDPRMPTISGLRRRGYTPASIRNFCQAIGVAKADSTVDIAMLEHFIREELNYSANRVMGVLRPLKVVITNYPEGQSEMLPCQINPEQPEKGDRMIPFSREIYIEESDFMEDPPSKFHRLAPGKAVRLKAAYIIECEEVIKDKDGKIVELHCSYDPLSKSGMEGAARKVKGTIHWVDAQKSIPAEVRLYEQLFCVEAPDKEEDFRSALNPESLTVLKGCRLEPSLASADPDLRYQFLRHGYFILDQDSTPEMPVFNRIVSLKDSWAKTQK